MSNEEGKKLSAWVDKQSMDVIRLEKDLTVALIIQM